MTKFCRNIKMKLVLLNKMLDKLGLGKEDIGLFKPNLTKNDDHEQMKQDYLKLMRNRDNDLSFETDLGMYKVVCKMYQQLFGITLGTKKCTMVQNLNYTQLIKKHWNITKQYINIVNHLLKKIK